jgi:hypothetical protein
MQLADYQHLLAKIYTNAEFRKAFFARPIEVGAEFGLTEDLSLSLAATYQKEIQLFSETLIRKRLGTLRSFLPITVKILGNNLEKVFREYAENQTLNFEDRYAEDAFKFVDFLKKQPHFLALTTIEQSEIIFEKLQIRLEKPYFRIYLFKWHPLNKQKRQCLYLHLHFRQWYWTKIWGLF